MQRIKNVMLKKHIYVANKEELIIKIFVSLYTSAKCPFVFVPGNLWKAEPI